MVAADVIAAPVLQPDRADSRQTRISNHMDPLLSSLFLPRAGLPAVAAAEAAPEAARPARWSTSIASSRWSTTKSITRRRTRSRGPHGHRAAAAVQGTAVAGARDILEKLAIERMITKRAACSTSRRTRGCGIRQRARPRRRAHRPGEQADSSYAARDRGARRYPVPAFPRGRAQRDAWLARLREREVDSRVAVIRRRDPELPAAARAAQGREGQTSTAWRHIPGRGSRAGDARRGEDARARVRTRRWPRSGQGADSRQVAASFSDAPDAFPGRTTWAGVRRRVCQACSCKRYQVLKLGQTSEILRRPAGFPSSSS